MYPVRMCGVKLWYLLSTVLVTQGCVALPMTVQLEQLIDELHAVDASIMSSYRISSSTVESTAIFGTLHHLVLTLLTFEAEYVRNVTLLVEPEATRWLRVRPLSARQVELVGSLAFRLSHYEAAVSHHIVGSGVPVSRMEDHQHLTDTFSTLCTHPAVRPREDRRLSCWLQRSRREYWSWRLEALSDDPNIVFIHNLLMHAEVQAILSASISQLTDSEIISYKNASEKHEDVRHSQSAWLDETLPVSRRIDSIITDITNMDTEWRHTSSNSENLQVLQYGPGGVYHPHYDFTEDSPVPDYIKDSGDRIATFIIYLQEPSVGGATVFPLLDVVVEPKKGGAVFWYNLLQSGEPDRRTLHGGCPVELGEKWVAAKWVHERGQMFARPCGPRPES